MPTLKRRLADVLGKALGAKIINSAKVHEWIEESYLGLLLSELRVDCVFDVGANVGQFGQILRRSGYRGTILSFEPNPSAFSRLEEATVFDPHWHVINTALGRSDGNLPFHVMKSDVFSSFRRPSREEDDVFSTENSIERTIDVPVRRLDSFIGELTRSHQFTRPFLKMDTQGYDLDVIEGAGEVLKRFVGLSSEVSIHRIYENSPTMAESIDYINSKGFDFVNFLPVHPDMVLNPVEFNGYAVRRDLAIGRELPQRTGRTPVGAPAKSRSRSGETGG